MDRIIERIKGLLNLSDNNTNQAEAEAALGKAMAMLLKYNLTLSDVDFTPTTADYHHDDLDYYLGTQEPLEFSLIGALLSAHYSIRTVVVQRDKHLYIRFVGLRHNAECAQFIYVYLANTFTMLFKAAIDAFGYTVKQKDLVPYRKAYYEGLTVSIDAVLTQQKEEIMSEWALIALDHHLTDAVSSMDKTTGDHSEKGDPNFYVLGINDGQHIALNKALAGEAVQRIA